MEATPGQTACHRLISSRKWCVGVGEGSFLSPVKIVTVSVSRQSELSKSEIGQRSLISKVVPVFEGWPKSLFSFSTCSFHFLHYIQPHVLCKNSRGFRHRLTYFFSLQTCRLCEGAVKNCLNKFSGQLKNNSLIIFCALVQSGFNVPFSFLCQHHSKGCESSPASGQLQSPQHALSQRQASGQDRNHLLAFPFIFWCTRWVKNTNLPPLCFQRRSRPGAICHTHISHNSTELWCLMLRRVWVSALPHSPEAVFKSLIFTEPIYCNGRWSQNNMNVTISHVVLHRMLT